MVGLEALRDTYLNLIKQFAYCSFDLLHILYSYQLSSLTFFEYLLH